MEMVLAEHENPAAVRRDDCHPTRIPPQVPDAGKYVNPSKRGPKIAITSNEVTTLSLDSESTTNTAPESSTNTRTRSLLTLEFKPRTFHTKKRSEGLNMEQTYNNSSPATQES
jgi:hypothetical protein